MRRGQLELSAHRETARTEINGEWEPIDTNLQANSDGTYSPAAITIPLAFSPGGSEKIVTAGEGDDAISFAWSEGDLPAARVEGNQITYPEIRPGVDLVFTAQADGYSDALVVKSKAAAEGLAAKPAAFTGTSDGLDMALTDDGVFVGRNPDTGTEFIGPPAIAWDSTDTTSGQAPPDETSSGTGTVHPLPPPVIHEPDAAQGAEMTTTVAPPPQALAAPETTYPLYLDPEIAGRSRAHYLTVHQNGWNYHDLSTQPMRVGYCGWYPECNNSTQGNARSYFTFDISALSSIPSSEPVLFDVRIAAQQMWSATSTPQPVVLRKSGDFDLTDNWPGPAGDNLQTVSSSAGRNGENPAWLKFDNEALRQYVFNLGSVLNRKTAYFALAAPVNNDKNLWKKFNNDVRMTIVFGYPPKITSYSSSGTVSCPNKPVYSTGSITVAQRAEQVTQGDYNLRYRFQVFSNKNNQAGPWDSSTLITEVPTWNDQTSRIFTLPSGKYAWRAGASTVVGVNDPNGNPYPNVATWTNPALRPFTVDNTKPAMPTILPSDDFPENEWGASASSGGEFRIDTLPSDAAGIAYSFNKTPPALALTDCDYTSPGQKPRPAAAGPITITAAPDELVAGVSNTLNVYAFDDAHNATNVATYQFYVPTSPAAASSRVEAEDPSVLKTPSDTSAIIASADDPTPGPGRTLTITSSDPEASMALQVKVPAPGYYAVGAKLRACSDCGDVAIEIPSAQVQEARRIPATDERYINLGGYSLGDAGATADAFYVSVKVQPATKVELDYLYFVQIQQASYGSDERPLAENLAKAFNNRGIGTAGQRGPELAPPSRATPEGEFSGFSDAELNALDAIPGGEFNVRNSSIKFNLPEPRLDAQGGRLADNVIAAGQRIRMPKDTFARHVDFLVTASCANVVREPRTQFDLVHQPTGSPDGPLPPTITTNAELPSFVPEWRQTGTESGLTKLEMPQHLRGPAATVVKETAGLYVLTVEVNPAHYNTPLVAVTLPSTGASLYPNCDGAPRLHVFAIATRQ